ncbi:hypothetical protein Clacol_010248 [Clathrus columnatus]|uniref:Acyl-protein thioesterase 1 n=1 Tax=Clathrus columnatus TaxID=1419009 RepID=A0AAV5AT83_9AGAM|nr:hypothetical protein Clacol_010248 [Clathrus columnatus]
MSSLHLRIECTRTADHKADYSILKIEDRIDAPGVEDFLMDATPFNRLIRKVYQESAGRRIYIPVLQRPDLHKKLKMHETFSDMLTIPPTSKLEFVGLTQPIATWAPWLRKLAERFPSTKWILPQATIGTIIFENNRQGPRWYDVYHLPPELNEEEDIEGALRSRLSLIALIKSEIDNGVAPEQIYLIGFSQGSSMALLTGLSNYSGSRMLGGIGVLAGWMPFGFRPDTKQPDSKLKTRVFWAYGSKDEVIPPDISRETMLWLEYNGSISLEKREYDGLGHEVNDAVFADLVKWLREAQEAREERGDALKCFGYIF